MMSTIIYNTTNEIISNSIIISNDRTNTNVYVHDDFKVNTITPVLFITDANVITLTKHLLYAKYIISIAAKIISISLLLILIISILLK